MAAEREQQSTDHLHTYHPGEEEAFLERIIFSSRPLLLITFLLATLFLSLIHI